ncbi:hypothetical protein ACFX2H_018152 [Malus domestica]
MAYLMHTDKKRCLLFPSTLSGGALNCHEYSHCAEANDKTALNAFTTGLRDCFFKYIINANTWKTYSEMMAQAYNLASAEVKTYQRKPSIATPYQQVGSGSQIQPNKKTSTFQTAAVSPMLYLILCQAVNTVGQARVRISPTPRYKAYTPLNATCMAIYLSIAYLIPKPKPRHPNYKPTKNTSTFCCYHEHNGHDGETCITLRNHIEALAREGKVDQFLIHPPKGNCNQRQVNVIYSISGGTTISKSSNRAMKNSERALRLVHQVFHVEDIKGGKYQKPNCDPICFYPEEERSIIYPHNDPLIVEAHIANFQV